MLNDSDAEQQKKYIIKKNLLSIKKPLIIYNKPLCRRRRPTIKLVKQTAN